jgi:hypothetical protein
VYAKLAGVCRQFLDWDVAADLVLGAPEATPASTVLWCRSTRDKAQLASAPQWRVMQEFLEIEPDAEADEAHYGTTHEENDAALESLMDQPVASDEVVSPRPVAPVAPVAASVVAAAPMSVAFHSAQSATTQPTPTPQVPAMQTIIQMPKAVDAVDQGEVIDLPDGVSVLSAVLSRGPGLIATPITAPMAPGVTVAVSRERGLTLVAQTATGLVGLGAIAAAVRWLEDSRQLIAMAMPQLSIDIHVPVRVQLLIDHADRDAEALKPLLSSGRVTIQTYRKLRWGQKTGLLLDAA